MEYKGEIRVPFNKITVVAFRILILDFDVHHGNGTQRYFYNSKDVFYISIHRYDNGSFYPKGDDGNSDHVGEDAGEGFNMNIPLNGVSLTVIARKKLFS